MTQTVQPIRKISLSEQAAVATAVVAMTEKLLTRNMPDANHRALESRVNKMRNKRDELVARAQRVEGDHA